MSRANCSAQNCQCTITTAGNFVIVGDGMLGTPYNISDPTAVIEGIPLGGLPEYVFTIDGDEALGVLRPRRARHAGRHRASHTFKYVIGIAPALRHPRLEHSDK